MDKSDEDKALNKRVAAKEKNIKLLTTKYLELISKCNSATKNEMKNLLDEILNEIDLIEINTLKAKNIQMFKEKERQLYLAEQRKISDNITTAKEDIIKKKKELYEAKKHREYLIKCEEIAKQINEFEPPKILNEKIKEVSDENNKILKRKEEFDKNLKNNEEKINKILDIVLELNSNYPQNNNINNSNNNNQNYNSASKK